MQIINCVVCMGSKRTPLMGPASFKYDEQALAIMQHMHSKYGNSLVRNSFFLRGKKQFVRIKLNCTLLFGISCCCAALSLRRSANKFAAAITCGSMGLVA